MTDKPDTLSLEVKVPLMTSHVCDQHWIVLLGGLYRRVVWSTVRAVSMPWLSGLSVKFISNHDSPSEHRWRERWYQVLSAVGDVGLNPFTT